jgi:hypothetical protein
MATLLEAAMEQAQAGDCAAAIARVERHDHGPEAMQAYHELVQHAYWKRKDLAAVVTLAQAGLARMRAEAQRAGDRDAQACLAAKQAQRVLSYNLASFCWPGWNEPGITVNPREHRAGHDAAMQHLALARELKLGDIQMARANWIAGALHLSSGERAEARARFAESAQWATKADNPSERLLARGFELLCDEHHPPTDPADSELNEVKRHLASLPDGPDFVTQLETAARVFGRG